jgi:hypothetical protein
MNAKPIRVNLATQSRRHPHRTRRLIEIVGSTCSRNCLPVHCRGACPQEHRRRPRSPELGEPQYEPQRQSLSRRRLWMWWRADCSCSLAEGTQASGLEQRARTHLAAASSARGESSTAARWRFGVAAPSHIHPQSELASWKEAPEVACEVCMWARSACCPLGCSLVGTHAGFAARWV